MTLSKLERFRVDCDGQSHLITLTPDRTVTLLGHDAEDVAVMSALGANPSSCEKFKKHIENGILYHDYLNRRKTWPLKYEDLSLITIDQGTAKMLNEGRYTTPNPLASGYDIVQWALDFLNNNSPIVPLVKVPWGYCSLDTFEGYRESGWGPEEVRILWNCGVSPIMARAGRALGLNSIHRLLRAITLGLNDEFASALEARIVIAKELGSDWSIWKNIPYSSTAVSLDQDLEIWTRYRNVAEKLALRMSEVMLFNALGYSPFQLESWLGPLGLDASASISYLDSARNLKISLANRDAYLTVGVKDLEKVSKYLADGVQPSQVNALQAIC